MYSSVKFYKAATTQIKKKNDITSTPDGSLRDGEEATASPEFTTAPTPRAD